MMRKILRKLLRTFFNRNVLFIMMLLVQLIVLVLTVLFLSQHYLPIYLMLLGLDMILVVYITNTSENPSYKLPWLVAMLVLPVFAGLAYLLVKTDAGHRKLKRCYAERMKETEKYLPQNANVVQSLGELSASYANLSRYVQKYGGYPVYRNCLRQ